MIVRVTKSLRLPEDLCDYISTYRGDNFTEQFCNIVEDMLNSEPKRLQRLEILDKEIKEREAYAGRLQSEIKRVGEELSALGRDVRWGI